jgi:hypothetical protein
VKLDVDIYIPNSEEESKINTKEVLGPIKPSGTLISIFNVKCLLGSKNLGNTSHRNTK